MASNQRGMSKNSWRRICLNFVVISAEELELMGGEPFGFYIEAKQMMKKESE